MRKTWSCFICLIKTYGISTENYTIVELHHHVNFLGILEMQVMWLQIHFMQLRFR